MYVCVWVCEGERERERVCKRALVCECVRNAEELLLDWCDTNSNKTSKKEKENN